jgi:hypothetical protein
VRKVKKTKELAAASDQYSDPLTNFAEFDCE